MVQTIKTPFHFFEALFANIFYGFPGRKLQVIGVTGTDGKTTTVSLIYEMLRRAGKKAAKVTTIDAKIDDKKYDLHFYGTTPSAFVIQKFLRDAVSGGVTDVVLEVSSHGLDQFRVWGVPFEVGTLTNVTHEHLDYHKTFETYLNTKLKLLLSAKNAVINMDDRSFVMILEKLKNKKVFTYSLHNQDADYTVDKFPFETGLFGEFNLENCLAAIIVAKTLGVEDQIIRAALKEFRAPEGREEIVYDKEFTVMIDFAHTPNAIENLLREISKVRNGRIIHVFGAPGKRDTSKRPFMGKASAKYAQTIILTADDPRDEDVLEINQEIKKGIPGEFVITAPEVDLGKGDATLLFEIPDREKAVQFAIAIAKPGDFIVLTGKGHERELYVKEGTVPWDEREVVRQAIKTKFF